MAPRGGVAWEGGTGEGAVFGAEERTLPFHSPPTPTLAAATPPPPHPPTPKAAAWRR